MIEFPSPGTEEVMRIDLGGLARGVAHSVRTLLGELEPDSELETAGQAEAILKAAQQVQARFWSF